MDGAPCGGRARAGKVPAVAGMTALLVEYHEERRRAVPHYTPCSVAMKS